MDCLMCGGDGLVLCLDPDGPSVRSEVPCPACTDARPLHELLEEST